MADVLAKTRSDERLRAGWPMAWIPGGPFRMGSDRHYPEEAPVHRAAKHPADAAKACCIPENPRGGREEESYDLRAFPMVSRGRRTGSLDIPPGRGL